MSEIKDNGMIFLIFIFACIQCAMVIGFINAIINFTIPWSILTIITNPFGLCATFWYQKHFYLLHREVYPKTKRKKCSYCGSWKGFVYDDGMTEVFYCRKCGRNKEVIKHE